MNKVTTINLNGAAYQLEESGFVILQKYFDDIGQRLTNNPDKAEILKDFEQAIAEKCNRFLNAYKNVLSTSEIEMIIKEMGPIEEPSDQNQDSAHTHGSTGAHGSNHAKEDAQSQEKAHTSEGAPKRLYQIRDGALLSGVCTGLAAYFNIDVVVVRLAFVILTIVTGGAWIAIYFIMAVTVPVANTAKEKATASGTPFTAQELMKRARETYARFDSAEWKNQKSEWKKNFRENKKFWKENVKRQMPEEWRHYDNQKYHHGFNHGHQGHHAPWYEVLNSIFWTIIALFCVLYAYTHQVQIWDVVHHIPEYWHKLIEAIRNI